MEVKIRIEEFKLEELTSIENKILLSDNKIYIISDLKFEKDIKRNFFKFKTEEIYLTNIVLNAYNFRKKTKVEISDKKIIESFVIFHDLHELAEKWIYLADNLNAFGLYIVNK